MEKTELERQLLHMILGLLALAILLVFGRGILTGMMFFIVIIGLLLVNLTYLGKKTGIVELFVRRFERTNVPFPGWGSACYATGVLLVASFLTDPNVIAASIIILAIGDGIATLAGKAGRIRLPYNRKKTLEGTVAFFIASLPGYFFVGDIIIPIALIAAVVESLDLPLDDNVTIPVAITAVFLVIL